MSGISLWSEQERQEYSLTATRRVLSVGFLFNVVIWWNWVAISLLSTWHAKLITRYDFHVSSAGLRLALSASRIC